MIPDGLYVVDYKQICAGFVVKDGRITTCAPILRKHIRRWLQLAEYVHVEPSAESLAEMPEIDDVRFRRRVKVPDK